MSVDPGPSDVLRRLDDTPPLRERILEQLELLIISGSLVPGARLVEGDLADTLGVSRGPIREALQMLWRDGFVDLRPRQGAFVHVRQLPGSAQRESRSCARFSNELASCSTKATTRRRCTARSRSTLRSPGSPTTPS
jgi:DNA-binding FadR family transcriptional regulator